MGNIVCVIFWEKSKSISDDIAIYDQLYSLCREYNVNGYDNNPNGKWSYLYDGHQDRNSFEIYIAGPFLIPSYYIAKLKSFVYDTRIQIFKDVHIDTNIVHFT